MGVQIKKFSLMVLGLVVLSVFMVSRWVVLIKFIDFENKDEKKDNVFQEKIFTNKPDNFFKGKNSFTHFDSNFIYDLDNKRPSRLISDEERKVFNGIKNLAISELIQVSDQKINIDFFDHGRYRLTPDGIEYDVFFKNNVKTNGLLKVTVSKGFKDPQITYSSTISENTLIYLIVASVGNPSTLASFLDQVTESILKYDNHIDLTVTIPKARSKDVIFSLLKEKMSHFTTVSYRIVEVSKEDPFFTKELIEVNTTEMKWDLLMLVDEEVMITSSSLMKCRSSAIKDKKIYVPIPYQKYDPYILATVKEEYLTTFDDETTIHSDYGEWSTGPPRVICLYRNDLIAVRETIIARRTSRPENPINEKVTLNIPIVKMELSEGPTGENVGAINSFIGVEQIVYIANLMEGFVVQKSPDLGMFLLFKDRNCSSLTRERAGHLEESMQECFQEKAITLGSKYSLGISLLKITDEYVTFLKSQTWSSPYWSAVLILMTVFCFLLSCAQSSILMKHAQDNRRKRLKLTSQNIPEKIDTI